MVHDMENFTFLRNSVVVPRGNPRMVVWNDMDLPQGGCESSARANTNFPQIRVENGRNQKAIFVCNKNAEESRKTSQVSFELSL